MLFLGSNMVVKWLSSRSADSFLATVNLQATSEQLLLLSHLTLGIVLQVFSEEIEPHVGQFVWIISSPCKSLKQKEEGHMPRVGGKRNRSDRRAIKELLLSNHHHGSKHIVLRPVMAWFKSITFLFQTWMSFWYLLQLMLLPQRFIH